MEKKIARAKEDVARGKSGQIVVGRVVLDGPGDPCDAMAQMEILPGGYFATAVRSVDRPLTFRLAGYAPMDADMEGLSGDVIDLGTLHMVPAKPADVVEMVGKVALEGGGDPQSATVEINVRVGPVNTPSGGFSPRAHWAPPINVAVKGDGTVSAKGLAPLGYYLTVSAKGYVQQSMNVTLAPGGQHDLGTITLERPQEVLLSYIVAPERPFSLGKRQDAKIAAGEKWKATPEIYGYDLEFLQKGGRVIVKHAYGPCYVKDLGEGKLADFLMEASKMELTDQLQGVPIQSGHVYLVHQACWKHWILFEAEIKQPAAEFRRWSDTSGAFLMEARFVGVKDNQVQIKRRDGTVSSVPLDKLGEADRLYVEAASRPSETTVVPKPPVAGKSARVWYIQTGGPLKEAGKIVLHWGINGGMKAGGEVWQETTDTPMVASDSGRWYADITVGAGAKTLNFVVNDGNDHWDNNSEEDWNFATAK